MTSENKIETEAKFIIAEGSTFAALQRLTKLGEFRLEPRGTRLIIDRYLDTPQMHLYRSGYACRIRTKDDQRIVTLKSLTPAEGNVHRRHEIEQIVQSDEPENWGDGESTRIIKDLAGDTALAPLFVIHQTRHIRYANLQDKTVIECSLDEVSLNETTRVDYYNLEAELLEAGQEADLSQFIETLQTKWLLRPEGLSKFERGLININQRMEGKPQKLNQLEKITLNQLAKTENKHIARRAEIILMVNADISDADIALELGLTTRTIQKWKHRFEKKRLEIFPEELIHTMLVKETAMPRLNQSELTPPGGVSGSAVPPASLTKDSVPLYPVRESIGLTPPIQWPKQGAKYWDFILRECSRMSRGLGWVKILRRCTICAWLPEE
jgi:inorganic triphosphatase YgiF